MIPMYLFSGANKSSWSKKITRIDVDYFNSINFTVNGTFIPYQTFEQVQAGLPPEPQTGTATVYPADGWTKFQTIKIEQNSPFDMQILSIDYHIKDASVS
jgi:hypothetical protein